MSEVVDLRKISKAEECEVDMFCKGLEYAGRTHKYGYFHYTKWSSLAKMMTPVKLEGVKEKRCVLVTKAPKDKNDLSEGALDGRYWYVSFTHEPHELVQMWVVYGQYSPEAVRVCFDGKMIKDWAKQDVAQIGVYEVPEDAENGVFKRVRAKLLSVKLFDVGYFAKEELGKRKGVIHRHRKYTVDLNDLEALRKSGQEFGPYFKEATWADEKEVRLLLVFDKPIKADKIAIDFDAPIADVRANLCTRAVTSPWLDMPKIGDVCVDMCKKSNCKGKIRSLT